MCLKSSPTYTKLKPKKDLQMQIKTVFSSNKELHNNNNNKNNNNNNINDDPISRHWKTQYIWSMMTI